MYDKVNAVPEEIIKRQHCGLFHCPVEAAAALMPDFEHVFAGTPIKDGVVDARVSMLMPGQYPCIPGWHLDLVPRDTKAKQLFDRRSPELRMYMVMSGPPFTEFKDGRKIDPWRWVPFTQYDEHRGRPSREHCWRFWCRIVPRSLMEPASPHEWLRRHSQVYVDAENFKW